MKLRRVHIVAAVTVAVTLGTAAIVVAQHPLVFDLKFGGLLGKNEIPQADPDGKGTATATLVEPDTVCFALTVDNIGPPVAAHIHIGQKHQNGPVVVGLTPPSSGDPGTSSGCVSGVSADLMNELRFHPGLFYWNVHTSEFPGGAVRGQVFNVPK